jgi:Mn2+/Fe2+ NRAMP family transporter
MSKLAPLKKNEVPKPLRLRDLIGPSFIILGVGLGSGELILWPYLSSNYGLGIIWAAVLGITFQFFINMEIERYTLATGESIFVGLTRKYGGFTPIWFIFTTLVPWMWPGIAAASATVFAASLGIEYSGLIGISLLVLMGIIYSIGSVVYKTQEQVQKAIILIGVPFVFLITLFFAKAPDWAALGQGLIGKGEGFWFLPMGLPIATFLGALAYAGAGGNLNLAQSLYVKEKGYGMGKYSGRITSIFSGKKENIELTGTTFEPTQQNVKYYKIWWKRINIEHTIVFWITGAFTMVLLSLLAYATVYGNPAAETSINFVILEGREIAARTIPAVGTFFLVMAGVMLFGTQFSVLGSNARISTENLILTNQKKFPVKRAPKFFYIFLWLQILAGVLIFALGFTEPLALVVTGAVLNAISMFIYSGLVLYMNMTSLQKVARPAIWRAGVVLAAFLFYGGFSIYTILQRLIVL